MDNSKIYADRIKRLHAVVTTHYDDLDEILKNYLKAGQEIFDLEVAMAGQFDKGEYVISAIAPNALGLEAGTRVDSKESYCFQVYKQQRTIMMTDLGNEEPFRSTMVYKNFQLETYMATPIYVRDEIYGTLCFSSKNHRSKPFDDFDKELIEMMGQSVGKFIECDLVKQDLEEEKTRVLAASKMSALGKVAGEMAHEINNPLAIIDGSAENIKRWLVHNQYHEPTVNRSIDTILSTVERISEVVAGLKSFARDSNSDHRQVSSVGDIIDMTLSFTKEKFKNCGIEYEIGEVPDAPVYCNHVQLSQVLLNLLNNAIDAVVDLPEKWVRIDSRLLQNKAIEIRVTDSGSGIAPDHLSKIMTPLFTTKPEGKGTGLGLSISKEIVESHGGRLNYESGGPNTCFKIVLPIYSPQKDRLHSIA